MERPLTKGGSTLHFFCAHEPTPVQRILAQHLGYEEIVSHAVVFGDNPEQEIKRYTAAMTIALVAPTSVILDLLREGYTLVEFSNISSRRRYFLCSGAWVHQLAQSKFVDSPIPLGEQEEILIRNPQRNRGRGKDGKSPRRSKMGNLSAKGSPRLHKMRPGS